jgi:hypothetical protein
VRRREGEERDKEETEQSSGVLAWLFEWAAVRD